MLLALSVSICNHTENLVSAYLQAKMDFGERGSSVVECRTPEREVGGSKPTVAVLCP